MKRYICSKPFIERLLLLLWLLTIALIYFHATNAFDQDLGRHLKLGEIIWREKSVPKVNLFSYTHPTEPVFNSHWGSQVVFFALHSAFGVEGLIFTSALVNTLAFGLLFWFAARRVGLAIPSVLFVPFSFLLLDRTWIRPEMFGNLFYAILLITLFSNRVRKYLKWVFPLIVLAWINLHITAVFGVFAMAVVLLQDVFSEYSENSVRQKVRRSDISDSQKHRIFRVFRISVSNLLIFTLIIDALMLNPYGIDGMRSAFTILNKYGYTIVENQSWLFLRDFGFPLVAHMVFGLLIVAVSFFVAFFTKRKPPFGELILLAVVTLLAFRFVRNEVLFAYTAFITTSLNLARVRFGRWTLLVSIISLVISSFIIARSHQKWGLAVGFGNYENYERGVDFFIERKISGPIFNNFDIGGYLIYRIYPKERVFVDNRPEAYPVSFFQDVYKPMQFDPAMFDKFVKQYGIQTIIWGRRDITDWSIAFLERITKNSDWQVAYIDDAMLILTKTP